MSKLYALVIVLLLPFLCNAQKEKSAFFLGNSYTFYNNLPDLISSIADSKGDKFTYDQHTPGGASFNSHVQDSSWRDLNKSNTYDYFILQGQSAELAGNNVSGIWKHLSPNFYEAEYLQQINQEVDSCRQTLFFMTWGYKFADMQDYLNMQESVSSKYVELAHTINASVSPVGEAWKTIIQNYPNIPLHSSDLSHPNLAGSYLAACVFYTAIFNKSPAGSWVPNGISAGDALVLQQTAYATVNDNLALWNIDHTKNECVRSPRTYPNKWEKFTTDANHVLVKLQFTSRNTGYAKSTFPATIYATHDKGSSWDTIPMPVNDRYFDFHFVSDSVGFLASSSFTVDSTTLDSNGRIDQLLYPRIFKTIDAGISWQELPLDVSQFGLLNHSSIYWINLPNIYLHFDDSKKGSILYFNPYSKADTIFSLQTMNGGSDWQQSKNKLADANLNPILISADTAYVSSLEPENDTLQFWRTIDGGQAWENMNELNFNCCKTVWKTQYVKVAYQGSQGLIVANNLYTPWLLRTKDINTNWDSLGLSPVIGELHDITEIDDGILYAIYENPLNHIIALSNDYGATWQIESYHDQELNVLAHTDEYIYAAGRSGAILRKKIPIVKTENAPCSENYLCTYPNPAKQTIHFQLPQYQQDFPIKLAIYNMNGILVDELQLTKATTTYNTSSLRQGVYLYHAADWTKKSIGQGKFIIR